MLCLTHSYYVEEKASKLWLQVGLHLLPGFTRLSQSWWHREKEMHANMPVKEMRLFQEFLKNYNLQQIYPQLRVYHYRLHWSCTGSLSGRQSSGTKVPSLFFQRQQAKADLAVQGDKGTWSYSMDMSQRHIKIPYFVCGAFTGDLPHTSLLPGGLSLCAVPPWDSGENSVPPWCHRKHR